jgi:FtsH-binding integral membrane protein
MENIENLDPARSFQIIEEMIGNARNELSENGHLYLFWGYVILGCSMFHFAGLYWDLVSRPDLIWMLTWVASFYQLIYLRRKLRKLRYKTYSGDMLKAVWLVFICCGVILGFVVGRQGDWKTLYPLILMLYGIPTILSGVILRFRPLIYGGIGCWMLSIAAVFAPFIYNLLMVSIAVIGAWIIPGYMLRSRFRLQKK